MMEANLTLLEIAFFSIAIAYSMTVHAGESGYIANMANWRI